MARVFNVKTCGFTEISIDSCELIISEDDDKNGKITGIKIDNEVLTIIADEIKGRFNKPRSDEYVCESCGYSWTMQNKLNVRLLSCVLCGQDGCVVHAKINAIKLIGATVELKNAKRFVERHAIGGMVCDGTINEDTELWLWNCVFDYFTHE